MTLNQWQQSFLRRLVELGGSVTVPDGVVNQDLIDLVDADYVTEGDGGSGRTYYQITKVGRAAIASP
jgi:DNA-binding PadR family transcriptional regulator